MADRVLTHTHGEVYSIQYYVIKFFSDLLQANGFLEVLWFPTQLKFTIMIKLKY